MFITRGSVPITIDWPVIDVFCARSTNVFAQSSKYVYLIILASTPTSVDSIQADIDHTSCFRMDLPFKYAMMSGPNPCPFKSNVSKASI